jgi:hypothetical protein
LAERFARLQVFRTRCRGRLSAHTAADDPRFERRVHELDVSDPRFYRSGDHDVHEILPGSRCERAVNPGDCAKLHAANRPRLARRHLRAKVDDRKRERSNRKTSELAPRQCV